MPSPFGFMTPEEASEQIRQRFLASHQQIAKLGRNATPGQQLGSSLSNIFGRHVQRMLDTRYSRKEERDRLMDQHAMTKEQATEVAKLTIEPEFLEVRKAKRMQEISKDGQNIMDRLIEARVPADRARAVAMLEIAGRMELQGFGNEASAMRIQASELLQGQDERDLENIKAKADISATRSATKDRDTRLASDSDNYILIRDGRIVNEENVATTDPERAQELRELGYVKAGPSSFSLGFTSADFGDRPQPIPSEAQEDIIGGFNIMRNIGSLRNVADKTGFFEGPVRGVMANMGLDWYDNQGMIDAAAINRQMRADIQALIKGIPSNYDAGVFEATIPNPFAFKHRNFFEAQLNLLENNTRTLLEMTFAFHKGTKKPVPQEVLERAADFGINFDVIEPMSKDEIELIENESPNSAFARHERQFRQDGRALKRLEKRADAAIRTTDNQQEVTQEEREAMIRFYGTKGQ